MPATDPKTGKPATPWHVDKSDQCPASTPWAVITDATGKTHGCFGSRPQALKQLAVLYIKLKNGEIKAAAGETDIELTAEQWEEVMAAVVGG